MPSWSVIAVVVALPALVWLVWRRIRRSRGVVVSQRGILQPALGWGWIPWDEIEGAYTPSAGSEALHVRLRVSERLAPILRERRVTPTPLAESVEIRLDLAGSRLSAAELLQEILEHRPPPGEAP